jgi:hypothetical protein
VCVAVGVVHCGGGAVSAGVSGIGVSEFDAEEEEWEDAFGVGCCAIQLAIASGLDVITTCLARNFEVCKKLGASEVFDHHSENIIEELTASLKERANVRVLMSVSLNLWYMKITRTDLGQQSETRRS